jgi:hypothetical protein
MLSVNDAVAATCVGQSVVRIAKVQARLTRAGSDPLLVLAAGVLRSRIISRVRGGKERRK